VAGMPSRRINGDASKFESISQDDLPEGRKGKHHTIVAQMLNAVEELEIGRALKIPLTQLPDTKANVRSALNRASKQKNLGIATSSDEGYLYVWKIILDGKNGGESGG
jgi:hypothetical protein